MASERIKKYQQSEKGKRAQKRAMIKYKMTHKGRAAILWWRAFGRKKPNFQITKLWVEKKLREGRCEVTGIEFSYDRPKPHYNANPFAPSLDRIDCKKGYTYKNTQVVIWGYNVAKSFLDPDDFEKLIDGIGRKFYGDGIQRGDW